MDFERWHEIDRIFRLAIDRGDRSRASFLDHACEGDDELRRTVESLLDHAAGLTKAFDRLGQSRAMPPVCEGDRLGPWRVGPQIGEGGMSVVFEATRDDAAFERRVALKILKQTLLTSGAVERFRFECRVLARLEHPAIARLYDAGTTEQGLPFLVMERVDGVPLDTWAFGQSLAQRLAVFERIAEAVSFAHRRLVVHRDLKPSNVLVTVAGVPKLLDFGIARLLPENGREMSRITVTGQQPMTPQYASPEQLLGDDVTTASDVYSLGLVLYELLAGVRPYCLENGSHAEVARLLEGGLVIRPPSVAVRQLGKNAENLRAAAKLRGDLDAIVMTALAEDPARRYPSTEALIADLNRHRTGLPVHARRPRPGYLIGRFVWRHRLAVAAAGVIAVLLIGFALAMAANARALVAERSQVARERTQALEEAATSREIVRFLGGLFEGAEPDVHRGRALTARELLDRGAAALGEKDRRQPARTRAALAAAVGKAYLELGVYDEAGEYLELSLALRSRIAESEVPGLAESHALLARLSYRQSLYADAAEHAAQAVRLLESARTEPVARVRAHYELGRARTRVGEAESGEEALRKGLEILNVENVEEMALKGLLECGLGAVQLMLGRHPSEARPQVQRGLALLEAAHGELHPDVFECRRNFAFTFPGVGEFDMLLDLLADQRALFRGPHEQILWNLTDLGSVLAARGRHDEAATYYGEALAMHDELFSRGHLAKAVIHAGLGHSLFSIGRVDDALEHFHASVEVARQHVQEDSADLAIPLLKLGDSLRRLDRCEEALPYLEGAHRYFQRAARGRYRRLLSMLALGHCEALSGVRAAGLARLRRGLEELMQHPDGFSAKLEKEWRGVLATLEAGR